VFISQIVIGHPNWNEMALPVSPQHEMRSKVYFGYPYDREPAEPRGGRTYTHSMMPSNHGLVAAPHALRVKALRTSPCAHPAQHQDTDRHLRDSKAVTTCHVQPANGDINRVHGLLVDAVELDRKHEVEVHKRGRRRGYWTREATPEAAASLS
jgi:hypothetical protein